LNGKKEYCQAAAVVVKTAARDLKVRNEAIILAFKENQSRANYILSFARAMQKKSRDLPLHPGLFDSCDNYVEVISIVRQIKLQ